MNRRHGRPFNHTVNRFTSSSIALFAAMTTQPTAARKTTIDTLIRALMKAGIWTQLDVLYVTAAATSQAALLNWKNPTTFTLSAVNAPTFAADRGYTGNGTTSRLDSAFVPSANGVNFTQNSASLWVWSRTEGQAAAQDIGTISANRALITGRTVSDQISTQINDATASTPANTTAVGWLGASRVGASTKRLWRNGVQISTDFSVASVGLPTTSMWMCGANATGFSARQQAAGAWGASLAGKELAFYNAMQAYMTTLGA